MSGEVNKIRFGVYADTSPAQTALKGLESTAKKVGAAIGIGMSVKSLVSFGKSCIDAGASLKAMRVMTDTAFETMSDKAQAFAQSAASAFGLSESTANKMLGTYGSMAKAFGFAEQDAYNLSTTLTGLAGDVASYYHISQDDAFTKLQSVFTGETESLKALGVVMSQTALDSYALANGFGQTTSAMSDAEKVALRYQFVVDKLQLAHGDFSRYSQTWSAQVSVLKLQIDSLKASIGEGLIAVLRPALIALNVFIGKLVQAANVFKKVMTSLFGSAGTSKGIETTSTSLGNVSSGLGDISTSAGNAAKATKKATKAQKELNRTLAGFDKINKLSKNSSASDGSGGSGGSGGGGGVGSGGGISSLYSGLDDVAESVPEKVYKWPDELTASVDRLKKSFGRFFGILKSAGSWALENVLIPLGKWTISKLLPKLLDVLSAAFDVLSETLTALQPVWQWIWDHFLSKLAKIAGDAIIVLLTALAGALEAVADIIQKHPKMFAAIVTGLLGLKAAKGATSWIAGLIPGLDTLSIMSGGTIKKTTKLGEAFLGLKKKVLNLKDGIGKAFKVLKNMPKGGKIAIILTLIAAAIYLIYKNWDKIKPVLQKAMKKLKPLLESLKKIGEYLKGKFLDAVNKVKEGIKKFKDLWDGIKDKKAELEAEAKEKVEGAIASLAEQWDTIKDRAAELVAEAKDKASSIVATLKDKWDSVKDKVSTLTGQAKDALGAAWSTIKDAWNAVKDKAATLTAKASDAMGKAIGTIKGAWSAVGNKTSTLTAKAKNAMGNTISSIKKKWDSIKSKTATLSLKFSAAASDLKAWINNKVISKINAKFRKVPILRNHTIPYLAQGGYVGRNTPQLAVIGDNTHEGEIVAPESKLQAMAQQAANAQSNAEIVNVLNAILSAVQGIDPNVYIDGKDATSVIVKQINAMTRATGHFVLDV